MRLQFNKQVPNDISRIMDYYESVSGSELADEFFRELQKFFQTVADNPENYSVRERDLRRVNLDRFPYHFLYRIAEDHVRVVVVRHHRRRPSLGARRR